MKFIKKPTRSLLNRYDFQGAILFIKENKNDLATVIYCTKHFISYIKSFISYQITDTSNINILITSLDQDFTLSTSNNILKRTKQKKKVIKNIKERITKKQNNALHEENLFNFSFLEKDQNSMISVAGHLFKDVLDINTTAMNERLITENEDFISRISFDNNNMSLPFDTPSRETQEIKNISASINTSGSRSFTKIDNNPIIRSSVIESSINGLKGVKMRRPLINNIHRKEKGELSLINTLEKCLSQIKNFVRYVGDSEDNSQEQGFHFEGHCFDGPEMVRRTDVKSVSVLESDENDTLNKYSSTGSSKMNLFTKTIDESPIKKFDQKDDIKEQFYNLLKFQHEILQTPTAHQNIIDIEFHDILKVVYGNLTKTDICQHFWSLLNLQSEGKINCEMNNKEINIKLNSSQVKY